tara:strand:+ start:4192 stop:5070 length:879 start_codon:yes stop_codon:yes gene_type:complete
MANLKELRSRIKSVNSTLQITSAMKMVSAAKLRQAQNAITAFRPYSNKLKNLLSNLSSDSDIAKNNIFFNREKEQNVLIIMVTGNKGLCGAFNSNIIKKINEQIDLLKNKNIQFITVGKKGHNYIMKNKFNLMSEKNNLVDKVNYNKNAVLSDEIIENYVLKKHDKVIICYNKFKNAANQTIEIEQILPIKKENINSETVKDKKTLDYIFEPNKEKILNSLIPQTIKSQLHKAILDSIAAEHGARMTAMHKATDNATELNKELKLSYNKARQASITGEILEIVGGAEALKNN